MGIFGGTKSNNTKCFLPILIEGEEVEAVYRLVLDEICFTNAGTFNLKFSKGTNITEIEKLLTYYICG